MKLNGFPFNGWDWTELAKAWNLYIPESYSGEDMYDYAERNRLDEEFRNRERKYTVLHDDGTEEERDWNDLFDNSTFDWDNHGYEPFDSWHPIVWFIKGALHNDRDGSGTRVTRKLANDVRAFCRALATDSHKYYPPLWLGMAEIEHDWTLLWLIIGDYPLIAHMWD
jgi:hypothetical protein